MATTISLGPLTRVEGHLDIAATVNGSGAVEAATSSGTMFRGFEVILRGRDPRDAPHYTQRICGVCPISHGVTASLALEAALGLAPNDTGRVLRNLILGSNFVQSHILHFYHLALLDYVDTSSLLTKAPWSGGYVTADMIRGTAAQALVQNYVRALVARRQAHQMGAIFGGKMPISPSLIPGGCSSDVTATKISQFKQVLGEVQKFINDVYLRDVEIVASAFPAYFKIGRGPGNLLAFGVFDLDSRGTSKLLKRGRVTDGQAGTVDQSRIVEFVKYSHYTDTTTGQNPSQASTVTDLAKTAAYSWIKAPRYDGKVHEVGPLARMTVNGDYRGGISVMDRLRARALEAKKVADAMVGWLGLLRTSSTSRPPATIPATASGIGLAEAPRGALGHWLSIKNAKIDRYQIIAPTGWNASPKDDRGLPGAIEQALISTPVADAAAPIELLRVVHSFDPCLACSVHLGRAARKP